jgi:hypothetical protein
MSPTVVRCKMRLVLSLALSVVAGVAVAGDAATAARTPGNIRLLPGYSLIQSNAVDAAAWEIRGPRDLRIIAEAGWSEGAAADPGEAELYSWYREQIVKGWRMRVAMVKSGRKTAYDESLGERKRGDVLLVSFIHEPKQQYLYAANFMARVKNQEEVVDVLLMVMTANPGDEGF